MSSRDDKTLTEGPFDFIRGAASETGRKISQSAPVKAGREIYQAGKSASQAGDARTELNKIAAQLAHTLAYIEKVSPMVQKAAQPQQPAAQQQQQPQANPRVRAGVPATGTAGPTPGAMRIKHNGPSMQFNSFMQALHGDDEQLKEGLMDFMQGAGKAAATKVRDSVNAYASKGGSALSDIYNAGMNAHGDAKAKRAAEEQQQIAAKYAQAKKQASDMLKQMFKLAATFGDNSGSELLSAARKSGGNKANRISELIQMYGPQYGVKV